jgi:REP element-mobilizing transposase RayT
MRGGKNPSRERKRAVDATPDHRQQRIVAVPLAYLITFSCYGTWLHGDEGGSVDRRHNIARTPPAPAHPRLRQAERDRMQQAPYEMDNQRQGIVLSAIREACLYRGWALATAHVRTKHVHLVVHALEAPEKVMGDLKAHASRKLNEADLDGANRKRWTRHGSTRYLWKPDDVEAAIIYVISEQGQPMAVYENPDRSLALAAPIVTQQTRAGLDPPSR